MTDPFSPPPDRPAQPWGPPPWAGGQAPRPPAPGAPAGQAPAFGHGPPPYAPATNLYRPGAVGAGPGGYPPLAYPQGPYRPAGGLRHPLDPDVRTSTKTVAVLVLGITAVLLMFCVGGFAPAVLALALARSARAELQDARGFLAGERMLRAGVAMSWIALATSVLIVFGAAIMALISFGGDVGPRFDPNVD